MELLRSKTVTDAVYERLKSDILSGVYKPGEKLYENELAKKFDVSRTPIRDATIRLEKEGLITMKPNKRGIFIRKLSKKNMEDHYETRAVLEGLAAKLATIKATEKDHQRLSRIIIQMEDTLNENKNLEDFKEIVLLNIEFHSCILRIADNSALADMLATLSNVIILVRSTSWINKNRILEVFEEHKSITSMIISGNEIGAKQEAEEHIYKAWKSAEANS